MVILHSSDWMYSEDHELGTRLRYEP